MLHSLGPQYWTLWTCIAFLFGVSNGFYWNRRWTFEQSGESGGQKQFAKFILTNLIGLGLNLLITKGFLILFLGDVRHPGPGEERIVQLSSICAIPLVVIWNFTASRLWTFKKVKLP